MNYWWLSWTFWIICTWRECSHSVAPYPLSYSYSYCKKVTHFNLFPCCSSFPWHWVCCNAWLLLYMMWSTSTCMCIVYGCLDATVLFFVGYVWCVRKPSISVLLAAAIVRKGRILIFSSASLVGSIVAAALDACSVSVALPSLCCIWYDLCDVCRCFRWLQLFFVVLVLCGEKPIFIVVLKLHVLQRSVRKNNDENFPLFCTQTKYLPLLELHYPPALEWYSTVKIQFQSRFCILYVL